MFNRMTTVRNNKGVNATYAYQPNGLRYSKTLNGNTSYFYWNPTDQNILADFNSDGSVTNIYSRGLQLIKNNTNTYYSYNGHGDVTALTDGDGVVTNTYDYDAFGVEINKDENDTNPFRYCGEYFDNEIDEIYLKERYYSPAVGRFTTPDSHWNINNMIYGDNVSIVNNVKMPDMKAMLQGINLYPYSVNNPIIYRDENGEFIVLAGIALTLEEAMLIGVGITIVAYINTPEFREAFTEAVNELEKDISDAIIYAKGKAKKPKTPSKLKNGEDKVKTPDTHPDEFDKKVEKGRVKYKHKKTGWEYTKDNVHGGEHWDASPDGKSGNYIHVNLDGKII